MNYIKQLQNEVSAKNEQLQTAFDRTTDILRYLSSEKFHGFENNYVNTEEAKRLITELRNLVSNF
jgi:hypothetical protein